MMDLMAYCGAESSRKNEFPSGMRVLAVDDDITCLKLLETLLKRCGYEVTIAQHAITALGLLRENKDNYDIVISDVQMPEMDGFQLLEVIGLEMDLPVIMLSVNGETSYVMKGVLHGAVDYLVKPVRIEDLKLIWKHVIKKSLIDKKGVNNHGHSNILEKKADNDQYLSASSNCTDQTNQKEDYATENTDGELSKHKRPRVSWSTDLHTRFIKAVSQLGFDGAVPKRILELMNVQGITRENVASHLQKYRKTLKKNGIGLNQQYHADPAIHRLCVDSSSSVILSFKEEARAKGVSPAKHSLGDCQKDSTILSSVSSQDSYRRAIPSPFQQCSSFSTAGVRTRFVGHSRNSLGLERANPSLGVNSLNRQALTSISKQVDEYSHDFYQNRWSGCGNLYPVSSCDCEVVQRPSYQDSFDAVDSSNAGLNDSAELNSALPHFDMTAETSRDILSTQRYDAGNSSDTCHMEFRNGQSEDSSIDTLFNLNRCNSADDLNTILKQFQQ